MKFRATLAVSADIVKKVNFPRVRGIIIILPNSFSLTVLYHKSPCFLFFFKTKR